MIRLLRHIFYKPTDSKQYLNFYSHHHHHTKVAIPYNLVRRICTIVSELNTRMLRLEDLKVYLKKLKLDRFELLKEKVTASNSDVITHVSTYNSNFSSNSNLIKNLFDNLKNNSDSFENKTLILAKRQPPSLKNLLTKACFTNENLQGVVKCNINRCKYM